jgi:hypothetical protein
LLPIWVRRASDRSFEPPSLPGRADDEQEEFDTEELGDRETEQWRQQECNTTPCCDVAQLTDSVGAETIRLRKVGEQPGLPDHGSEVPIALAVDQSVELSGCRVEHRPEDANERGPRWIATAAHGTNICASTQRRPRSDRIGPDPAREPLG